MLVAYVLLSIGTAIVFGAVAAQTSWIAAVIAASGAASLAVVALAIAIDNAQPKIEVDKATSHTIEISSTSIPAGVIWC